MRATHFPRLLPLFLFAPTSFAFPSPPLLPPLHRLAPRPPVRAAYKVRPASPHDIAPLAELKTRGFSPELTSMGSTYLQSRAYETSLLEAALVVVAVEDAETVIGGAQVGRYEIGGGGGGAMVSSTTARAAAAVMAPVVVPASLVVVVPAAPPACALAAVSTSTSALTPPTRI